MLCGSHDFAPNFNTPSHWYGTPIAPACRGGGRNLLPGLGCRHAQALASTSCGASTCQYWHAQALAVVHHAELLCCGAPCPQARRKAAPEPRMRMARAAALPNLPRRMLCSALPGPLSIAQRSRIACSPPLSHSLFLFPTLTHTLTRPQPRVENAAASEPKTHSTDPGPKHRTARDRRP
jgi:hypothetical protein